MPLLRFSAFADTAAPTPPAGDARPVDLKEARFRLAKAASPADYAAMLDSFSTALNPSDALALLDQGLAQAEQVYKRALLVKAADLDLLVGLFGDAAARYEAAAGSLPAEGGAEGRDPRLLLRAARCYIAAGDSEKASSLSADVVAGNDDPDLAASGRLVEAWALAMQGRAADASSLASSVAAVPKAGASTLSAECRREAGFILWLCADASGKAGAASALASAFPGSPEALIAAGSASAPPLPHWYLGGLGAAAQETKRPSAAAPPSAAPTVSPATSRGKRLQIGYFSREDNAQALKAELASKGFTALVEPRLRPAAAGKAEERRWIVAVEGGKDIAKTMQSLRDAGYESYIIE
jgi:cell division septation protein DedD